MSDHVQVPSEQQSLRRIADALERIAEVLEHPLFSIDVDAGAPLRETPETTGVSGHPFGAYRRGSPPKNRYA